MQVLYENLIGLLGDVNAVEDILQVVKISLNFEAEQQEKYLEKQKDSSSKYWQKQKDIHGTTYTPYAKEYYFKNKEKLNAARVERQRERRAAMKKTGDMLSCENETINISHQSTTPNAKPERS